MSQRGKQRTKLRKKEQLQSKKRYAAYKQSFVDNIRKFDDPILKQVCITYKYGLERWSEKELKIAGDMSRTLIFNKGGVGLAANQIGYDVAIIATKSKSDMKPLIMFNPEIISHGDKTLRAVEGCLSYPGYYPLVERYLSIKIKYIDINCKEVEKDYEDFEARIVQHEVDHISGKCLVGEFWELSKTNPEIIKQNELEAISLYNGQKLEQKEYEVVESEDFKKEKQSKEIEEIKSES